MNQAQIVNNETNFIKSWYMFVDDNNEFTYKTLYNAVKIASKKIYNSISGEIRIYKVVFNTKRNRRSLECVTVVKLIEPRPPRKCSFNDSIVFERLRRPEHTIVWKNKEIYSEFNDKKYRNETETSQ